MEHATQTQFGRPVEAVLNPNDSLPVDKWKALDQLTEAAEAFGLSHRTLGVLRALLSFYPDRYISPHHNEAIVFPSNRNLCARLNGMPDSTLRRHLALLVDSGVVIRRDSANRKRFARRMGQGGLMAFGFDLSPLAIHNTDIAKQAQQARDAYNHLQGLRAYLATLRQELIITLGESPFTKDLQRTLRRKPVQAELEGAITQAETYLAKETPSEMSTPDDQNERHIESDILIYPDSETDQASATPSQMAACHQDKRTTEKRDRADLVRIIEICPEFKSYYPQPIRHWHDLINVAGRLTNMVGIDAPVFIEAVQAMGHKAAAVVVLYILENLNKITNPGGYLRRLTQSAGAGRFDVTTLLASMQTKLRCKQNGRLSADNLKNHL